MSEGKRRGPSSSGGESSQEDDNGREAQEEHQETESEEQQAAGLAKEIEQFIDEANDKIQDGEIENAENLIKQILEKLKEEEELYADIESKIEDQLDLEEGAIQELVDEDESIERKLEKYVKNLENIVSSLERSASERKIRRKTKDIQPLLDNIHEAAEVFDELMQKQSNYEKLMGGTVSDESNAEKIASRLHSEFEAEKEEISAILKSLENVDNQEVDIAESEKSELEELLSYWKKEENEVRTLREKQQQAVKDLGELLGDDEKILSEMKRCLKELENLRGIIKDVDGNFSTTLNEIERTEEKLEQFVERDSKILKGLKNGMDSLPSFSDAKENVKGKWGYAKEGAKNNWTYILLIGAGILGLFLVLLITGTLFSF